MELLETYVKSIAQSDKDYTAEFIIDISGKVKNFTEKFVPLPIPLWDFAFWGKWIIMNFTVLK